VLVSQVMRTIGMFCVAAIALCGCEGFLIGHGCTEIGCIDSVQLTLRTADDSWPDGSYRIELTFGESRHVCQTKLPDDFPDSAGSLAPLRCEPELDAWFNPRANCVETRTRDAVSQSCTPIRDHWTLEVSSPGTPATLQARVERDGASLLDTQRELEYEESRPNGPDCEPLCRQAAIRLTLR
jgi:hypothetical protein